MINTKAATIVHGFCIVFCKRGNGLRVFKYGENPLRGFPHTLFRMRDACGASPGEPTLRSDFGGYRTGCAQLLPSPMGSAKHI